MSQPNPELEQRWRALLTEWKQSNLTISAFCERHHLIMTTFGYWQKKLRIVRLQPSQTAAIIATCIPAPPRSQAFVPVTVVAEPLVEVSVPGGLTFKLPLACDPESIGRWLTAARSVAC